MVEREYFRHDYGARNDLKLARLRQQYGLTALGAFWCLTEMLHEEGGELPLADIPVIARAIGCQVKILNRIVRDSGLFSANSEIFWSNRAKLQILWRKEKKLAAQRSAHFRWNTPETNANAMRTHCDGNASKVKDSKVKDSKVKERIVGTPLTPLTQNDNDNDLKKGEKGTDKKGTDEVALDIPDLPDQDPLLARCVKVWEDNTAQLITPGVADGIDGLIEQYEPLWGDRDWFGDGVRAAFLAHRGAGGINLAFVSSILKRWSREGYPGKAPDNTPESYELAEDMVAPNISVKSAVEIAEGRREANALNTAYVTEELRRRGIAFTPKEHPS